MRPGQRKCLDPDREGFNKVLSLAQSEFAHWQRLGLSHGLITNTQILHKYRVPELQQVILKCTLILIIFNILNFLLYYRRNLNLTHFISQSKNTNPTHLHPCLFALEYIGWLKMKIKGEFPKNVHQIIKRRLMLFVAHFWKFIFNLYS